MNGNTDKVQEKGDFDWKNARYEPIGSHNRACLGRIHGGCRDWAHCAYCSPMEQALRAVPKDVISL